MRSTAIALAAATLLGSCTCNRGSLIDREGEADAPNTASFDLDLVVVVVIDQWPSWSFEHDEPVLDGGLARLIREGIYFAEAEYPYASTFTAPGHTTIGTGVPPSRSGILANGWFRREKKRFQAATEDPNHPVFDLTKIAAGEVNALVTRGDGASPSALLVDGVSDALRAQRPDARVVSIGIKQRAAVLQTGRRPHLAIWYDDDRLAMTTGTFWTKQPPEWLIEQARTNPVSNKLHAKWDVSDPEFLAAHTGGIDDYVGEASVMGFDRAFPHDLAITQDRHKAMRVTPLGTALTLETAIAAIAGEKLGQRGQTDLLAITVSSHDYAGHFWGQSSWERFDTLRQIDRQLGAFLEHLDQVIGRDRYAVVVTSDHGAVPLLERSVALGRDARRIPYEQLLETATTELEGVLGEGNWMVGYSANSLYLSDEALGHPKISEAIDAAVVALRDIANMGAVGPRASLAGGDCERHSGIDELLCRSAHPERSGEILLAPDRYSLFVEARFPTGSAHGTPSVEDRMVPLIVRVPSVEPRRPSERPSVLQVAPTVSKLLGIRPPSTATAPPVEL